MAIVHLLFGFLYGLSTFGLFALLARRKPRWLFGFSPRKGFLLVAVWLLASMVISGVAGFALIWTYRRLPWAEPVSQFSNMFALGAYSTVLIVVLLWRRNQKGGRA